MSMSSACTLKDTERVSRNAAKALLLLALKYFEKLFVWPISLNSRLLSGGLSAAEAASKWRVDTQVCAAYCLCEACISSQKLAELSSSLFDPGNRKL